MTVWAYSLASVVAVSLVSLVGVTTLMFREERAKKLVQALVGFAAGALLGDAFIHLIPHAFVDAGMRDTLEPSLLILLGMLLFFVVEKLVLHRHGVLHPQPGPGATRPELATVNVIGDGVHNFIDGVVIAASYVSSPTLGLTTTLAVLLHEIPQEFGDFAVLLHSGVPVKRAVLLNLLSASLSIVGTVAALLVGGDAHSALEQVLVPVTAGGFVYIAAADLVPELQHDRSLKGLFVQATLISAGIAVMAALAKIEG